MCARQNQYGISVPHQIGKKKIETATAAQTNTQIPRFTRSGF